MNELEIFILAYALMTALSSFVFPQKYVEDKIIFEQLFIKSILWPYLVMKALTEKGGESK